MLRLVAHARKLAVSSALAIAALGIVIPIPAAAAAAPTPLHWDIAVGGGDFFTLGLNRFYPSSITVHPGDVVSFNWGGFHTVTFNPPANFTIFDSFGAVGSSSLDSHTTFINATPAFSQTGPPPSFDLAIASTLPAGKYRFHCSLHQFMSGEVNVTQGALPSTNAAHVALGNTQLADDTAQATILDNSTTRDAAGKSGEAVAGVGNRVAEYVKVYPSAITVRAGPQ